LSLQSSAQLQGLTAVSFSGRLIAAGPAGPQFQDVAVFSGGELSLTGPGEALFQGLVTVHEARLSAAASARFRGAVLVQQDGVLDSQTQAFFESDLMVVMGGLATLEGNAVLRGNVQVGGEGARLVVSGIPAFRPLNPDATVSVSDGGRLELGSPALIGHIVQLNGGTLHLAGQTTFGRDLLFFESEFNPGQGAVLEQEAQITVLGIFLVASSVPKTISFPFPAIFRGGVVLTGHGAIRWEPLNTQLQGRLFIDRHPFLPVPENFIGTEVQIAGDTSLGGGFELGPGTLQFLGHTTLGADSLVSGGRLVLGNPAVPLTLAGQPTPWTIRIERGSLGEVPGLFMDGLITDKISFNLQDLFATMPFVLNNASFDNVSPALTLGSSDIIVTTMTGTAFNAGVGVNVNATAVPAGSRISMSNAQGPKAGTAFEIDPNNVVEWGDCFTLTNDNFKQFNVNWATQTYNHTNVTIQNKGCALSALATLSNFYKTSLGLGIPTTQPDQLNEFLKQQGDAGYLEGDVVWKGIKLFSNNKIRHRTSYDIGVNTTLAGLINLIDADINARQPVIVRIVTGFFIDHFMLIVGKCGDKYVVSDPGSRTRTLYDPRSETDPLIGIRQFVARP